MTSERMSPVDTAWLHMDEPNNPADIVGLMIFDEQLSYEGLTRAIEERMLKFDRFKQRVIEVDVFHGPLNGLITAEVEFRSRESAADFTPPPWLHTEVTADPRYKNRCLATDGLPGDD